MFPRWPKGRLTSLGYRLQTQKDRLWYRCRLGATGCCCWHTWLTMKPAGEQYVGSSCHQQHAALAPSGLQLVAAHGRTAQGPLNRCSRVRADEALRPHIGDEHDDNMCAGGGGDICWASPSAAHLRLRASAVSSVDQIERSWHKHGLQLP
jgi:hypothetical protein